MTMPHLINCPHSDDSWCLTCVKELYEETERMNDEIRKKNELIIKLSKYLNNCEEYMTENGVSHEYPVLKDIRNIFSDLEYTKILLSMTCNDPNLTLIT